MLNYQRVSLVNIQYQKPIKSPMSDSPKSESLSQDCQYLELCERGSNSIQVFHRLVFALCLPACNCHFRIRPEFHAVAGHSGHGGQGRRSPPKWMSFFSYRSSTRPWKSKSLHSLCFHGHRGHRGRSNLPASRQMRQPQFGSMIWRY